VRNPQEQYEYVVHLIAHRKEGTVLETVAEVDLP